MWRRQLLDPHGENPLKAMQVTGEVKRVRTPRMGFVLEMLDSSPPTKLLMPKPSAPRLNLRHRYLVVEVRTDPFKKFSIQIEVKDNFNIARTLTLSAGLPAPAPELARGGGAKAKLPLLSISPPGQSDPEAARREGWRLGVFDLDYLIRRAFDGAPFLKLESVALVGICHALSITASAEVPQVAPPGPVRLMAGFDEDEVVRPLKPPPPPPPPNPDDPDDLAKRVAAAREAEQFFLKKHLAKAPQAKEAAVDFIPAGYDVPDAPSSEPSAMPARFQAAVRRLRMANRLGATPGSQARRYGDPRDHLTTRRMVHANGDHDDASMFKREQQLPGDTSHIPDERAVVRVAFGAAQELARRLRWGNAGEVADLSDQPMGESGARLLSFVLPKGQLRELRFNGANIGDAGAAYMATALRAMTTARYVDLRHNHIGPKGGVAMAGAIEAGCIGVTTLLIGHNDLGASGIAAVAAAIPRHRSLERIGLESTACGHGLKPLFRDGDVVSLDGGYVVHERTGRRIPRADGGGGGGAGGGSGGRSTLRGMAGSERLAQMIDLRTLARPPLQGAVSNCGSNDAIEALVKCVDEPLSTLRYLHLGGNFGGATRKELQRAVVDGPNGLAPKGSLAMSLGQGDEPAADAAAEAAMIAEAHRQALLEVEEPLDEEVALTETSKKWMSGPVPRSPLGGVFKPGASALSQTVPLPPAPSLMSQASFAAWGGLNARDDDDDDDEDEPPPPAAMEVMGGALGLTRSQTMTSMQSSSFALTGGRYDAQAKPMEAAGGDGF